MDIKDVRTTIQSAFDTLWASETPIAWDNVRFDSDTTEFVRLSIQWNDGEQASLGGIGNRLFRQDGFVFLQVFTELNENPQRNDELLQKAFDHFVTPLAGIRYYNPKPKHVGPSGNYYQQNIIVQFQVDQQK